VKESWSSANQRMACIQCGASDARPYVTQDGRAVRVCNECLGKWDDFRLMPREPMYEEPGAQRLTTPCD
jgi:hypothetical protein